MARSYRVIDADGHVLEPIDLWDRYMDPKYHDRAPVQSVTQVAQALARPGCCGRAQRPARLCDRITPSTVTCKSHLDTP